MFLMKTKGSLFGLVWLHIILDRKKIANFILAALSPSADLKKKVKIILFLILMQLVAEVFLLSLSLSLTKIEELLDFVFDSAQNLIGPKKKTIDCLLSMKI